MLDRIDERQAGTDAPQYCKILECELYTDTVCGAKRRTDREKEDAVTGQQTSLWEPGLTVTRRITAMRK